MSSIKRIVKAFNSHKIRLDDAHMHCLSGFYCGLPAIDKFIKENALKDQQYGKGVTTLVVDDDNRIDGDEVVVAYYTLCATAIFTEESQQLLPSVEILMFALNECYQNILIRSDDGSPEELIATRIFNSMLGDIYGIATDTVGFEYVVLHSVPDAIKFYKDNAGFSDMGKYIHPATDFEEGCTPMYMKLFPEMPTL